MATPAQRFLKAVQSGVLDEVTALLDADPSLLMTARSTSKGYSAMHYAAMAGTVPMIELLASHGLAADDAATIAGVTPLQVALEYKRLPAARSLQQLRDASRGDAAPVGPTPPPAEPAPTSPSDRPDSPGRPASPRAWPSPRFPAWAVASAARGGLDIAELDGPSDANDAEACRLSALSVPFVWRRAGLCPAFPKALQQLQALRGQTLDTNVARGADRKFAYFSPERLESGVYEPEAVRAQFAPMRLNEQLRLEETLRRQRRQAASDATADAGASAGDEVAGSAASSAAGLASKLPSKLASRAPSPSPVGRGGWRVSRDVEAADGAPYVMHRLLEAATAAEARMLAERGGQLPPAQRPGIAALGGLCGSQYAMWAAGLEAVAKPLVEQTAWARVGRIASAGGWDLFEQAGLMVSGRDALTPTHYDGHHNIFLQLAGAKRFLLFAPEHGAALYPFPALHPLDPLSRVDLELPEVELVSRWPRARHALRGNFVELEAGDVLVMPQGVWHQVHSLGPHNMSINLLFGRDGRERATAADKGGGGAAPPLMARVPAPRRAAALAELAKSVELLVLRMVGPARLAAVLAAVTRGGDGDEHLEAVHVIRQVLAQCLAPPTAAKSGSEAPGGVDLPAVDEFARSWFDARRFDDLPLRQVRR